MNPATKECSRCKASAGVEAAFCPKCGQSFQEGQFVSTRPSHRQCQTCGNALGSFVATCPRCAQSRQVPAVQQPAPPPVTPPAASVYPPVAYSPPAYSPPAQIPHVQCVGCRQWVPQGSPQCLHCGTALAPTYPNAAYIQGNQAPVQQVVIQNMPAYAPLAYPRPRKEKVAAGLLGILLGGFGGHHFYLGNTAAGVLSIVFCWTYIPAMIGFIQGILLLCMNEDEFHRRHG